MEEIVRKNIIRSVAALFLCALFSTNTSAIEIYIPQYEELIRSTEGQQVLEVYVSGIGHGAQMTNVWSYMTKGKKLWRSPDLTPIALYDFMNWLKIGVEKTKRTRPNDYGDFPIAQILIFEIAKAFPCS